MSFMLFILIHVFFGGILIYHMEEVVSRWGIYAAESDAQSERCWLANCSKSGVSE